LAYGRSFDLFSTVKMVSALATKRILVTGGAGFIGSHLVEALLRAGAQVRVLDNFSSGSSANLEGIEGEIELVEGDMLDQDLLNSAAAGCDLISHQAAQLEITRCIEDPIDDLRSNTEGTIRVFEAARAAGIEHVVYASSACVYGQAERWPEEETHSLQPNWPYGVSKLAGEHYARLYWELHRISSVGFRYSIVYGPREWYGRALTIFLKRVLEGESPVVFGSGEQLRDLIYVGDVVEANLRGLGAQRAGFEVLNVSTGTGTTIEQIASLVCEAERRRSGVELQPVHEQVEVGGRSKLADGRQRLPSELEIMVLDPSKAKQALDWSPLVPVEDGIARELDWLAANGERWTEMHY
jgi:UDP-glucose 4-epimerase